MWDDSRFADMPSSIYLITKGFGQKLLEQAGVQHHPNNVQLTVLDLACGSGVVTESLHETLQEQHPASFQIVCGDLADAMVQAVSRKIEQSGWSNTTAQKIDAQDTKLPDRHFTHVFTNFGPMLLPNPSAMMSECHRILRPGGVCAFSTWKEVGWVEDFQKAFASMPDLPPLPNPEKMMAGSGRWNDEDYIKEQLINHRFQNTKVEAVSDTSRFANIEDFLTGIRLTLVIAFKLWTPEERQKHANPTTEQRILDWFRHKYPHGEAEWHWVALLATGDKPEM